MSHRYCKYCVTELRSFKTCNAGVCSYCWDNPKRRAIFTEIKQERLQQQTHKTLPSLPPRLSEKELDDKLKELEAKTKEIQAKHKEMFDKKCVKCNSNRFFLLEDGRCSNCALNGR